MSRQSSAQAYNEFTKVLIKIHVAMSTERRQFPKYLYILFIHCFNLVIPKVLLCSRTRATDRHRITGTTRLDNMLKIFFQLINSIDISFRHKPRSEPTVLHTKPMLYFKPTFLYSNNDQISATVQDLKIRVQVVAPHLS